MNKVEMTAPRIIALLVEYCDDKKIEIDLLKERQYLTKTGFLCQTVTDKNRPIKVMSQQGGDYLKVILKVGMEAGNNTYPPAFKEMDIINSQINIIKSAICEIETSCDRLGINGSYMP